MKFQVEYLGKNYGTGRNATEYRIVVSNYGTSLNVTFHFTPPAEGRAQGIVNDAHVFTGEFTIQRQHAAALARAISEASADQAGGRVVIECDENERAA